jgi:flap endonuclease GEN
MGVTELWKILSPAQRHVPLEELRGQTLAVDLSIWVVEAEGVAQMKGRVVRPYLR